MCSISRTLRLHAYLEGLVGNRTTISVARSLVEHPGKVFTVRGLAKDAGVSPSEASLILRELEEAGAVKLQPVGRSYLVTPNEKSFVLQRIIKPLVRAESETLEQLRNQLKRVFKPWVKRREITSVYLFGSVVSGEEKKDSDVDIFIISNNSRKANEAAAKAQAQISASFNKKISPLIFCEREFDSKKNSKLIRSIASQCVLIAGKDFLG